MPIYCYKCKKCGATLEDYQFISVGSLRVECDLCGITMSRDYVSEKVCIQPDWPPGYNPGIDYHYKNKADLMGEIIRRGLYPSVHGGGITSTRAKPGLYGDEEFKDMYNPSVDKELNEDNYTIIDDEEAGS